MNPGILFAVLQLFSVCFCHLMSLFILIPRSSCSLLTEFQSNRSQQVMVDGRRSKLVNVVSGVPQGGVLGLLLFLQYTSELFPFWKIS